MQKDENKKEWKWSEKRQSKADLAVKSNGIFNSPPLSYTFLRFNATVRKLRLSDDSSQSDSEQRNVGDGI